jgi:arsenical resistance protein ArsH
MSHFFGEASIQGRWRRSIVFVSGRVTGFTLLVRGSAEYLTDRVGELKEVHSELATTLAATALNQEKVAASSDTGESETS